MKKIKVLKWCMVLTLIILTSCIFKTRLFASYSDFFGSSFDCHDYSFTYRGTEYKFENPDNVLAFGPNEMVKVNDHTSAMRMAAIVGVMWGYYHRSISQTTIVYENLDSNSSFLSGRFEFGLNDYTAEWVDGFSQGYYKEYGWLIDYLIDYDLECLSVTRVDNDFFFSTGIGTTASSISTIKINGNEYTPTAVEDDWNGMSGNVIPSYTIPIASLLANETGVTDDTVCIDFTINQIKGTIGDSTTEVDLSFEYKTFKYFRKQVISQVKIPAHQIVRTKSMTVKKDAADWFKGDFFYPGENQQFALTALAFNLETLDGKKLTNAFQIGVGFTTLNTFSINGYGGIDTSKVKTTGKKQYLVKSLSMDDYSTVGETLCEMMQAEGYKYSEYHDNSAGKYGKMLSLFAFDGSDGEWLPYQYEDAWHFNRNKNWITMDTFKRIYYNDNTYFINNRSIDSLNTRLAETVDDYSLQYFNGNILGNTIFHQIYSNASDNQNNTELQELWKTYDYTFAVDSKVSGDIKVIDAWTRTEVGEVQRWTSSASGLFVDVDAAGNKKVVNKYGEEQTDYTVGNDNIIIDEDGNSIDYNTETTIVEYEDVRFEKDPFGSIGKTFQTIWDNANGFVDGAQNGWNNFMRLLPNLIKTVGAVAAGILLIVVFINVVPPVINLFRRS